MIYGPEWPVPPATKTCMLFVLAIVEQEGSQPSQRLVVSDRPASVGLDEILEDQPAPDFSARLYEEPAFRKSAKLDRRETELFGELADLGRRIFIVAGQEHHAPTAILARILIKLRGDQVVEALDQPGPGKSLFDDHRRRLPAKLLGRRIGVHHVDDGLPRPVRKRLRDHRMRLETGSEEDHIRLDGARQRRGTDLGADRGRLGGKALRVSRGGDGHRDALSGERLGQRLADAAETDDCVAHVYFPWCWRPVASTGA